MVKRTVSKAELMLSDSKVNTQNQNLLQFFNSQFWLLFRCVECIITHSQWPSFVLLSPFLPVYSLSFHSLCMCASSFMCLWMRWSCNGQKSELLSFLLHLPPLIIFLHLFFHNVLWGLINEAYINKCSLKIVMYS